MDPSRRLPAPGQNRLLAALPRELQLQLAARMDRVAVSLRQVLYEPQTPIVHVYFPVSCAVSLLVPLRGGGAVEVGTVGNEGLLGVQVFLDGGTSTLRAVVQVAGVALRMRVEAFRRALEEMAPLERLARRYAQAMIDHIARATACNQAHSVQQRMCRSLLVTHDRVGADEFSLTQEVLAQMLGVRRPSVTVAACELQKAGLIRYQRGRIQVANRTGLEALACECYESSRRELERLLS